MGVLRRCHHAVLCPYNFVGTCWEGLTSWQSCLLCFLLFCHFPMCVLIHIKTKVRLILLNMFKPSNSYFTDRSKALLLLLFIFYVLLYYACLFLVSVLSADLLTILCVIVTFTYSVSGIPDPVFFILCRYD